MFQSLLFPENKNPEENRMEDFDFVNQLEIKNLIHLSDMHYFGAGVLNINQFFTTDADVIKYRLDIMEDLVTSESLYKVFVEMLPIIDNLKTLGALRENYDDDDESQLFAIKLIEAYIDTIDLLYKGFQTDDIHSIGLKDLKYKIDEEYNSTEYKNLKEETVKLRSEIDYVHSITIGVNIDASFAPIEAGILSINSKPFKHGNIIEMMLKKEKSLEKSITNMLRLSHGILPDEDKVVLKGSVQSALHNIFKKAISSWGPIIRNFYNDKTDFLINILNEIRFLISGVKFIKEMQEMGQPMCKPEIASMNEKACTLKGCYNPMILKKLPNSELVANDVTFDADGMFYLVTGPNHGGKSIFLYSVGVVQALFQLGLYVPAVYARMSPVRNIYTHFPSSDEDNYGKGRLESECARLAAIIEKLDEYSLFLIDEAFSSTSESEACYIATEVLTGIGTIGCRGIFVTHIHELSMKVKEFNSYAKNLAKFDNLTAEMRDKKVGQRSYEIVRRTPDGLSYAKDIARKYGLELSSIER